MPSTACRTTVDIAALGFGTAGPTDAEIIIGSTGDHTLVEVAHTDNVWSLTFDADGALVDAPVQELPPWLEPAIEAVAPHLQLNGGGNRPRRGGHVALRLSERAYKLDTP